MLVATALVNKRMTAALDRAPLAAVCSRVRSPVDGESATVQPRFNDPSYERRGYAVA
jgi:hypothetical protein